MADNYYVEESNIDKILNEFDLLEDSLEEEGRNQNLRNDFGMHEHPEATDCANPQNSLLQNARNFSESNYSREMPLAFFPDDIPTSNSLADAQQISFEATEENPANCFLSPVEYVRVDENQSNASAICSDQNNMAWNNRRPVQKKALGNEIFGAEGGIFREKAIEPAEFSLLKKPNHPVSDWPPIVQVERNRNGEMALTDCIDWGCPRVTASLMDILGISNAADRLSPSSAAGAETGPIAGTSEIQTQNHRRGNEKPFRCEVCPKVFARKGYLDEHRRAHTGEKPYGCNICGKKFVSQRTLRTHLRIHTGEYLFECKTCGQKFTTNCALTYHLRKHSGEKPFDCNICFKRFALKGTLTRHFRVHTKEKPFNCDICGKRFAQKISFKIHLLTHTGE